MQNFRKYGKLPFDVAVLHGGPGAAGEMALVAQELAKNFGVLEPLQTENSIDGQVQELKEVLEQNADLPVSLIGWSWGAWLGFIFAAQYPKLVKKLILIASGPFEEKYAKQIAVTRFSRLNEQEKEQLQKLESSFNDSSIENKNALFAQFGKLFDKSDSYALINIEPEAINVQFDIYQSVWPQAAELRKSGELLEFSKKIKCPVVAIHGDYDPHPYQGVQEPLSQILKDFKFILLEKCGHHPWLEEHAREKFFKILKQELK